MISPLYKKPNISILLFAFVSLFISSCVFNNDFETLTTDLQINVKFKKADTQDSIAAAGATVILYKSFIDMETRQRPVTQGTTDASGSVLLKNLEPFAYYVYVFYDNNTKYYDNSIGNNTFGDVLVEGALTVTNIPIQYKRSANPTSFRFTSMTVYKFLKDTVTGGCSQRLRYRLYNTIGTKIDSTDITSKCKYIFFFGYSCAFNSRTFCKTDKSLLFYYKAQPLTAIPPLESDYLYIYLAHEAVASSNNFTNYTSLEISPSQANIYPARYKKNNTLGNFPYPTRIRVWEDSKIVVDLNIDWQ